MPSTPSYLPVYLLAPTVAPTEDDYLVLQEDGDNGDVKLLAISSFISNFIQPVSDAVEIDSDVTDYYTGMGWTAPT